MTSPCSALPMNGKRTESMENRKLGLQCSRPSLLDALAHSALFRAMQAVSGSQENVYVIDATAGNGHDTCLLADFAQQLAGFDNGRQAADGKEDFVRETNHFRSKIRVLACDIQEEALQNTAVRLQERTLSAELYLCGHETVLEKLPENAVLAGAVFNLGYLPGKDRKTAFIATNAETSVQALELFCGALAPQGCISVHCYTGHQGGLEEYEAVKDFAASLNPKNWRVLRVSDINREYGSEYLFLLEKLQIKKVRQR